MNAKESDKRFPNYDAHMFVIANSPRAAYATETILLSNNGKFNPNGGWLTPNAMRRWIDIYVAQPGRNRIHHWVDLCVAAALVSKLEHV